MIFTLTNTHIELLKELQVHCRLSLESVHLPLTSQNMFKGQRELDPVSYVRKKLYPNVNYNDNLKLFNKHCYEAAYVIAQLPIALYCVTAYERFVPDDYVIKNDYLESCYKQNMLFIKHYYKE